MKKIIAILLSICCLFSCSCGNVKTEQVIVAETESVDFSEEAVTEIENSIADAIDDNYRNYYEVFVYSFADSNNDGIGDLKGVQDKLGYIEELGCNGIWLMPIMPSTTYHKYDVTDYYDIDEQYGTLEDFDSLISECHARKIRLIIDLVMNHTSSEHPWFLAATEYLKTLGDTEAMDASVCPYIDYYHFSKEKENGNWYQIQGTDYYYEAEFWSEMPDLNLSDSKVKNEFEQIASFWLERGVDGFRMDAPLHFEENDTEFNCSTLNWLYEYCKAINPDFYMVSEVWASEEKIAEYYSSKTPSLFDFSLADAEGDIVKTARGSEKAEKFVTKVFENEKDYKEAYDAYINAPFITNHDMGRVANALKSNENDIKMAGALLLSLGGSPYIYYGEELGMKSKGKKDENKRLPMAWAESSEYNCNGPDGADKGIEQAFAAVEEQSEDKNSIYSFYRKCLAIRNSNPEIARGEMEIMEDYTNDDIAVIKRTWDGNSIFIVYNTSEESSSLDLSGILNADSEIVGDCGIIAESKFENGILNIAGKSIIYIK